MAGQGFRQRPGGGAGLPGGQQFKSKGVEPTELGSILDDIDGAFGDIELLEHQAAIDAMTEEEKEAMEAEMAENEDEGEEEGQEQDEDTEKQDTKDRYRCYCGNPYCTIAFREGRAVRDPEGKFDRFGQQVED